MRKYLVFIYIFIALQALRSQSIVIYPDSILNPIPLFGYNMIPANHGFGIIDNKGNFDPKMLESIQKIKPQWLRFPGGTYANLYEWKRAIGVKSGRGGMHGWKLIPDDNWFGPDEAAQLMEKVDGQLVCVVNFNQGAQYAADWVEYMNAKVGENPNGGVDWAALRAQNGHPEPYHVKYWEIANEGGNQKVWSIWPKSGDTDFLSFKDVDFQNKTIYGGSRTFYNQKVVRFNAWTDTYIKTRYYANEKFQLKWYPVDERTVTLKIGTDTLTAIEYSRVSTFQNSGPADLHFTLNENTGEIIFGNGINGVIPPSNMFVFASYSTKRLDGVVDIFNAMKSTDSTILVADAFFFLRDFSRKDPQNVKYEAIQEHMASETMSDFKLYYTDVFKNAVSLATGGFPSQLDKSINSFITNNKREPTIFFTEYGIFNATLENNIQHARTITSAIYYALINSEICKRGNYIKMAGINYLLNHGVNSECAMDEGNSLIHPNGLLCSLFSNYFGKYRIVSAISNLSSQNLFYSKFNWNTTFDSQEVTKLYTIASIDSIKQTVYLMVINNTNNETLSANISGLGENFSVNQLNKVVQLNSTGLNHLNTASSPNRISLNSQPLPVISGTSFDFNFLPATVTVFCFDLNKITKHVSQTQNDLHVYVHFSHFSKKYTLHSEGQHSKINTISLYDMTGQLVFSERQEGNDTSYNVTIPNTISKGIYLLSAKSNTDVYTTKMMIS